MAEQIVQQGGAYLMVVKGNQAAMRAHIAERTAYPGRCLGHVQVRRLANGRFEQRTLWVAKAPGDLGWPHARKVLRLDRHIVSKHTGEVLSDQTVYAVTSLAPDRPAQPNCRDCGRHTGASRASSGSVMRSFVKTTPPPGRRTHTKRSRRFSKSGHFANPSLAWLARHGGARVLRLPSQHPPPLPGTLGFRFLNHPWGRRVLQCGVYVRQLDASPCGCIVMVRRTNMEDLLVIGCFAVALIALGIASLWFAPDEHYPVDPWTTPWAA